MLVLAYWIDIKKSVDKVKAMPLSQDEIRTEVERRLRRSLPDEQWDYFVRVGTVGIVEAGEENVSWLVREIRDVLARFGGETKKEEAASLAVRSRTEIKPVRMGDHYGFTRQDALCLAVATLAAKDPEVVTFRRDVLGDRLPTYALDSSREGVAEWIPRQLEREQPQLEVFTGEPPLLTYIKFIGNGLETTPVAPGGVLDRLRQLGDRLASRYRWQPHAAVAFVLACDVVPNIEVLTATIQPNQPVPALTRIVLTVDPAATPAAVAHAYRQTRNRITRVRAREMQPKTLFLAAFATERPPRESIKEQMAAWTAAVPRPWRYAPEQAANFVRDRNWALARLLRPGYKLPADEETITYVDFSSQPDTDSARQADRADQEKGNGAP
jgi:hypothetical protein